MKVDLKKNKCQKTYLIEMRERKKISEVNFDAGIKGDKRIVKYYKMKNKKYLNEIDNFQSRK